MLEFYDILVPGYKSLKLWRVHLMGEGTVVTTNFSDVFLLDFCATPMVTQGFRSACVAQPRSSYEILDFQLAQRIIAEPII